MLRFLRTVASGNESFSNVVTSNQVPVDPSTTTTCAVSQFRDVCAFVSLSICAFMDLCVCEFEHLCIWNLAQALFARDSFCLVRPQSEQMHSLAHSPTHLDTVQYQAAPGTKVDVGIHFGCLIHHVLGNREHLWYVQWQQSKGDLCMDVGWASAICCSCIRIHICCLMLHHNAWFAIV